MNKIVALIGVLVISLFLLQSCTKEEGLFEDNDYRESFMGSWSATDQCSKQTYGVDIKLDDGNSIQVIIVNFANTGRSAEAIIAGNNISVPRQDIGNDYIVSGDGKLSGQIISWTSYTFETTGNYTDCSATFTKK